MIDLEFLERLKNIHWRKALHFQLEIRPTLQGIPYWVAAVLVGFTAFFYSELFSFMINTCQWVALNHPPVVLVMGPVCFALGAYLVQRFAPPAGGTGIPQVIKALDMDHSKMGHEINYILNLRVMMVVVASSLLCILGGGGLGREGPMVHIAACLFYFVGRNFTKIWPYNEHRSWIVAGGAAGVAAAFNTPLAGIVFVLEELAAQHFHQFKTVVISAVIIAGMVAQWLSGKYLFLGYPRIESVAANSIPWAVVVGVACGLAAALFEKTTALLKKKTERVRSERTLAFAAVMGLAAAAITVFVDTRAVGGGIQAIQEILFTGEKAGWGLLGGRFLSTILSHLSGCSGGFLAPSLSLGAIIGSKIATAFSPENHNLLAMVGMAGFLSALLRAPFTALVIVMEMTDRHSAIFPLMITSLVSIGIVRILVEKQGATSAEIKKT